MAASTSRVPPPGVLLFLGYALLILGVIGVSLRYVIDQAISAPISLTGFVVMALLAYTIFTITMVLQRKAAAWGLAVVLSTLVIIPALYCLLFWVWFFGLIPAVLFALLVLGLRRPASRAFFSEP